MWSYLGTPAISGFFAAPQPVSMPPTQVQDRAPPALNSQPIGGNPPGAVYSHPLAMMGRSNSVDSWSTQGQWMAEQLGNLGNLAPSLLQNQQPTRAPPGQGTLEAGAQPRSIRSSLGNRGGVVRKADGYELFYGMVGDQPAPQAQTAPHGGYPTGTPTVRPCVVKNLCGSETVPMPPRVRHVPPQSVRTSLGNRGGVVRQTNGVEVKKADGYDVFYGIVGSSSTQCATTPRCSRPAVIAPPTSAQPLQKDCATHIAVTKETDQPTVEDRLPIDDSSAALAGVATSDEQDLATVNEEPANTSGDAEWFGSSDQDDISNELRKRLGKLQDIDQMAQQPKSFQQFSMATPACSFAPPKCHGQLTAPSSEGLAPSHFSIATPAASFAPAMH